MMQEQDGDTRDDALSTSIVSIRSSLSAGDLAGHNLGQQIKLSCVLARLGLN